MHSFRFAVSLRVSSQSSIDLAELCVPIGLEPKWHYKAGEPRMTPKGTPLDGVYDRSYCSFRLTGFDDEELHEMLVRVVDDLLQHKEIFRRIREDGGRAEFFIGWFSSGNTGDTFSHDLLRKMGELKIDLALDVYGSE